MSAHTMDSKKKRLAWNTLSQYALQFAKYLFPLITVPYLTRVLGPDVYAIRAYILATMTIVQAFLDYGFLPFGTKVVAEVRNDLEEVEAVSSAITFLRIGLCVLGVIPIFALCSVIPILNNNPACVALAYVAVCCKATLPDYVFQGMEEMGIITRRFVGSQAIAVVLIILFVKSSDDLVLALLFEAIAAVVALIWSWANILFKRNLKFRRISAGRMVGVLKASSIFFVSSAAGTLYTSLTTVLIGLLISDVAQISFWSLSVSIIGALQALFNPVANSLYPYMCANREFRMVRKCLLIGVPLVGLVTVLLYMYSNTVMFVVGGAEYVAGADVLAMLSPVLFLSYPAVLIGFPVLAAFDRIKQLTFSTTMAALFHIAGLFALAYGGFFAIPAIAVLRCCSEGVLLGARVVFVWQLRKTQLACEDTPEEE